MNDLTIAQNNDNLEVRTQDILEYSLAFEVMDDAHYAMADLKVVECVNMKRAIKEHCDPLCEATNKAHKAATLFRKNLLDRPERASKLLATGMANYKQKRDAKKAEEQRQLDDKAKKDHDAACEKEAKDAEANGNQEVAKAIREMKDEPPITPQVVDSAILSKTKFKADWEITNDPKVADVPAEYLVVDKAKILKRIRAEKGNIKIAGVEFKEILTPIRRGE